MFFLVTPGTLQHRIPAQAIYLRVSLLSKIPRRKRAVRGEPDFKGRLQSLDRGSTRLLGISLISVLACSVSFPRLQLIEFFLGCSEIGKRFYPEIRSTNC